MADIDNLGHKQIILKGDQEPTLGVMLELIRVIWNGDASMENSPVEKSQANGAIERAIQSWEGQARTMKDARLRQPVLADHPIMTWLVEYAAVLLKTPCGATPPPLILELVILCSISASGVCWFMFCDRLFDRV